VEDIVSIAEHKQLVCACYAAGNRGDFDACFDLIADDIRWTNIGTTPLSGTYRGKPELMEKLLGPLFGRLRLNPPAGQSPIAPDDCCARHHGARHGGIENVR
jgi:hypothetical protein